MDHVCPNNEKPLVYHPIALIGPKAAYISGKKDIFPLKS